MAKGTGRGGEVANGDFKKGNKARPKKTSDKGKKGKGEGEEKKGQRGKGKGKKIEMGKGQRGSPMKIRRVTKKKTPSKKKREIRKEMN